MNTSTTTTPVPPPRLDGYEDRACQDEDQAVFYGPADGEEKQLARRAREAHAKSLCRGCVIRTGCARWALGTGTTWEQYGVWGGLSVADRRRARKERSTQEAAARWQHSPQRELLLVVLGERQASVATVPLHRLGDVVEVQAAAALDRRTVAWHASRMATLLGLSRTAPVAELLRAAKRAGVWDGRVPSVKRLQVEVLTLPGVEDLAAVA